MKTILRATLVTLTAAVLTACGGGGGGSSDGEADASSYWTLDEYEYLNGHYSASSSSDASGETVTTYVVSTATMAGGDTSNGAYSGSSLAFILKGSPDAGVFTVVPDRQTFLDTDVSVAPIVVEATVGINTTTGASQYRATSGSVEVSVDESGDLHFSSVGSLPATKAMDVQGGVDDAPASTTLEIVDAY